MTSMSLTQAVVAILKERGAATEEQDPIPSVKGIWMLLLRQGGRWNVSELVKFFTCESSDDICKFVNVMTNRGYLAKYKEQSGTRPKYQYAVTKACKIPQGVEMWELIEAGVTA